MAHLIEIAFTAEVEEDMTEAGFSLPISAYDDIEFQGASLEPYLDTALLKAGYTGGKVSVRDANGCLLIVVSYWTPDEPKTQSIDQLKEFTVVQMTDGVGEGGFDYKFNGRRYSFTATDTESPTINIFDNLETTVEKVSRIGLAALENDEEGVQNELRHSTLGIDSLVQGFSALHHAVFHRNPRLIELLLQNGANPNVQSISNATPLSMAATNSLIPEECACEIASLLLAAGADSSVSDDTGRTPLEYAQIRGKTRLLEILRG